MRGQAQGISIFFPPQREPEKNLKSKVGAADVMLLNLQNNSSQSLSLIVGGVWWVLFKYPSH